MLKLRHPLSLLVICLLVMGLCLILTLLFLPDINLALTLGVTILAAHRDTHFEFVQDLKRGDAIVLDGELILAEGARVEGDLLQVGGKMLQLLVVGDHRLGVCTTEIVVPDTQERQDDRHIALGWRLDVVLVHLVRTVVGTPSTVDDRLHVDRGASERLGPHATRDARRRLVSCSGGANKNRTCDLCLIRAAL